MVPNNTGIIKLSLIENRLGLASRMVTAKTARIPNR
jgi:hypothetical protein